MAPSSSDTVQAITAVSSAQQVKVTSPSSFVTVPTIGVAVPTTIATTVQQSLQSLVMAHIKQATSLLRLQS